VENGLFGNESDCFDVNPLPEEHILRHGVSFHHRLHFNIENLQGASSFQSDHLRGWVHDSGIGANWSANWRLRVGHIDDDDLCCFAHFFADANEFVTLHSEHVEADARLVNPNLGQLKGQ